MRRSRQGGKLKRKTAEPEIKKRIGGESALQPEIKAADQTPEQEQN